MMLFTAEPAYFLQAPEEVTILYRRGAEQMKASDFEQELAQTKGVKIKHWARPVRLIGPAAGFCHRRHHRRGRQHQVPSLLPSRGVQRPPEQGAQVVPDAGHGESP